MSEAREPRSSVPISDEIRTFVRMSVGAVKSHRTFDKFNTDLKQELKKHGMDDSDAAVTAVVAELKREGIIAEIKGKGYGKGSSFEVTSRDELTTDPEEENLDDDEFDEEGEYEEEEDDESEDSEEDDEAAARLDAILGGMSRTTTSQHSEKDGEPDTEDVEDEDTDTDEENLDDDESGEEEEGDEDVDDSNGGSDPEAEARLAAILGGMPNVTATPISRPVAATPRAATSSAPAVTTTAPPRAAIGRTARVTTPTSGVDTSEPAATTTTPDTSRGITTPVDAREETGTTPTETGATARSTTEGAPARATETTPPTPHHSVHMNERQFNRWSRRIESLHRRLLHIISNLETGELSKLKEEFKAETGTDWSESFEVHRFLADRKIANIESNTSPEEARERNPFSESVDNYAELIKNVLSDKGLPDRRTGDAHLDDLIDIVASEGVDHRRAVDIFVNDVYEAEMHRERDSIKVDRILFMILARMLDKLEAFHAQAAVENFDENPPQLQAARERFLKAQEDFNEYKRAFFKNPFSDKQERLQRALAEARTAYETESAKVVAGRANRFLNEYNKQIDEEIAIRDARRGTKGDGFFTKAKDIFYAGYKWLGDMSVDRLYQSRKYGDKDADKGNPVVEGNEPRGGRMIRKAANLRTAIGVGLGVAGLMSGPLKAFWRGAIGLGVGIGVYERGKAKTTAAIQAEAHTVLHDYADSAAANPNREEVRTKIMDVMQQIRMRAALDGKTVEDERFPLHESFAKLRTLLEQEKNQLPKESIEQAFQNKDKILKALQNIDNSLETQITKQSDTRKRQIIGALAAGGASIVLMPQIMKALGWTAEHLADWIVGDPAVSADVGIYPDDVIPPPSHIDIAPPPIEIHEHVGEGIRVSLDRGEGAYHAVYKILDELSPSDRIALGEAIAKEHPEWITRDAHGIISNIDSVLRNWRHDIVDSAVLDDGREAMLYDASTGEYGVMLHEGAEFSIEYDAHGYPELHLHGGAGSGDYDILNEHLVRTVDDAGHGQFMTPNEYHEQIAAAHAAAVEPHASAEVPDVHGGGIDVSHIHPEYTGGTQEHILEQVAARRGELDTVFGEDAVEDGIPVDDGMGAYEMVGEASGEGVYPTGDDVGADIGVPEASAVDMEPGMPMEFTPSAGGELRIITGPDGEYAGFDLDPNSVSLKDAQYALLTDSDSPYAGVSTSRMDTFDYELRSIYLADEAIDEMIAHGMQGTPAYDALVDFTEDAMRRAAMEAHTSVSTLFDRDLVEAYDFELPEDVLTPDVGETIGAEPMDIAPVVPDVYHDITLSTDIVERIRIHSGDFERPERLEMQAYLHDMRTLGQEFDAAPEGSPIQDSLAAQLRDLRQNIIDILERVERRSS